MQHNAAAVQKTRPVVEVKGGNRSASEALDFDFFWLNVHEWRRSLAIANLLEDLPEDLLVLNPAGRTTGTFAGIENRRVIGECQPEPLPVEIVERLDEGR